MAATMQAILQHGSGGVDTLFVGETDRPEPAVGQLLVRVHAAGVNRADIMQREGRYPAPPGACPRLGLEVSGEVVALGEGVSGFALGDAVFGLVSGGGYAEYAVLDSGCAIHKPAELSHTQAASLPEAWMTAWFNLVELAQTTPTASVLIHAGASGVGAASIQLASGMGATVLATAGNSAKADFCVRLGVSRTIIYRDEDFAEVVRSQGGVDVILDCVGGDYLARNLQCLKPDGRLIIIGLMGGTVGELDIGRLLMKRLRVQGSTLRPQSLAVKAGLTDALHTWVLPRLLDGRLQLTLDRTFLAADIADAHRYVEANQNLGKVVLTWP